MKPSRRVNWSKLAGPRAFLRDKLPVLLLAVTTGALVLVFLMAFKVDSIVIILVEVLFLSFTTTTLLVEYWRRRNFYRALLVNLARLDQAYLVLETIEEPGFYDGQILYEALYAANKSMNERIKDYQEEVRNFREYVELWVHEVKTPLAALSLMVRNPKVMAELRRLDDFVDQVLYFSRAENAERDYLIGEVELTKVAHEVALRNQALLLGQNVDFSARDLNYKVHSDAKWLEFILGQIIHNSVKYGSKKIIVSAQARNAEVIFSVRDDGIGIDAKDLPRVFEKSFTGRNGRHSHGETESSTGMGLYIVKTLCEKLGHQIRISSEPGKGTTVEIIFSDHDYYLTKK